MAKQREAEYQGFTFNLSYLDLVFVDGDEATRWLDLLDSEGADVVVRRLLEENRCDGARNWLASDTDRIHYVIINDALYGLVANHDIGYVEFCKIGERK